MGAHMSCLTNITTFGKTREGFGTQIISGCHSPSFSYTLLKYVFSLRGAMVQIPLRTTVTLVANPEARRAHRTKPAYHLSSNGQLNAGRSVGRTGGRPDGRTDGRADGRADGWPKPKKSTFLEKKYFLAGRVRDGRLFPYFGRFFPYFRTGRPGAPRQKSTFRKKRYSSQFRIMTLTRCQPFNVFTAAFGPMHLGRHAATQVEFSPSGKKANSSLPHS